METSENKNGNNTTAITKLLGQLNLPTLATILLMGGSNFFATKSTSDEQRVDTLRAVSQIHDLHDAIDGFEKRQKSVLDNEAQILRNQQQLIERWQRNP